MQGWYRNIELDLYRKHRMSFQEPSGLFSSRRRLAQSISGPNLDLIPCQFDARVQRSDVTLNPARQNAHADRVL